MSGEPKTHTLEEAIQLLGPDEVLLVGYCGWEGMQYSVVEESSVKFLTHSYSKWEDALTDRLDRKVVARDEAAELRAENAQLRADLREYVEDGFLQGAHRQEDGGYSTGGISTYRDLGDWLVEHAGWTRREGGVGRMQVYDPPRRLAGGESER